MTRREKTQDTDNCVQLQQKGSGETKVDNVDIFYSAYNTTTQLARAVLFIRGKMSDDPR